MNNTCNSIKNQQNIIRLMGIYKERIIKCDFIKCTRVPNIVLIFIAGLHILLCRMIYLCGFSHRL